MYGEFSQNKDIHVTSIRLKKKKDYYQHYRSPSYSLKEQASGHRKVDEER